MKSAPLVIALLVALSPACRKKSEPEPTAAATTSKTASSASAAASSTAKPKAAVPQKVPAPPDVAAPPATAEKTASGLASIVLTPPTGTDKPRPQDKVKVNYTGWTKDGNMFDSTELRKTPASFSVGGVIPGWTEGLQLMAVGEKRRFWIPAELAYGEVAKRPGAPTGQLTFDVELLEVQKMPDPPAVPTDVAAVPANATKTKSGLASRVLTKGTGKVKPTAASSVEVHYSGWTTDGKMFDSSVTRGQTAKFGLGGVIKGWTEGLQLMVEGEKRRFWIPGELAYGNDKKPGKPSGMLVFDVELVKILAAPPGH